MELLALEQCLPSIQNFLSGGAVDLRWFAGKLTEKGLIHRQAADAVLDRQGTTNMERACGLMNAVVTQVEVDEEMYRDFCSVLSNEGVLRALDKKLTKAYGTYIVCCVLSILFSCYKYMYACVLSIHLPSQLTPHVQVMCLHRQTVYNQRTVQPNSSTRESNECSSMLFFIQHHS